MTNENSYDNAFNDGCYNTSFHNSKMNPPSMWPKSSSEMSKYTDLQPQSLNNNHDIQHSAHTIKLSNYNMPTSTGPLYKEPYFVSYKQSTGALHHNNAPVDGRRREPYCGRPHNEPFYGRHEPFCGRRH